MTRAIIMAQGKGSRWTTSHRHHMDILATHKQLLPVGDETVISRTIRQLKELGISDVWVIAGSDIFDQIGDVGCYSLREPTGSIIQGIIGIRHLWMNEPDVLFVLGDVLFSNAMMKTIATHKKSAFFGREGGNVVTGKESKEIFALRLVGNADHSNKFYGKLIVLNTETSMPIKLKLWDLYHYLFSQGFMGLISLIANDYTDDTDTPEEYLRFFHLLQASAISDDEKYRE